MVRGKRLLAGEDLIRDDSQRELIRLAVHRISFHLFRRHIIWRAHHGAAVCHLLRCDAGHTEIGDLGDGIVVHDDIGGLDVAVHDAFAMRVIERPRGLAQQAEQRLALRRMACAEQFFQRWSVDVLHEDVRHALFFRDVVNRDDVGMREDAGRLRLAEQPVAHAAALGLVREVGQADGLDGDYTADGGVLGLIDNAHGASAEFLADLITPHLSHAGHAILA